MNVVRYSTPSQRADERSVAPSLPACKPDRSFESKAGRVLNPPNSQTSKWAHGASIKPLIDSNYATVTNPSSLRRQRQPSLLPIESPTIALARSAEWDTSWRPSPQPSLKGFPRFSRFDDIGPPSSCGEEIRIYASMYKTMSGCRDKMILVSEADDSEIKLPLDVAYISGTLKHVHTKSLPFLEGTTGKIRIAAERTLLDQLCLYLYVAWVIKKNNENLNLNYTPPVLDVLLLMELAVYLDLPDLARKCSELAAANFDKIVSLAGLGPPLVNDILKKLNAIDLIFAEEMLEVEGSLANFDLLSLWYKMAVETTKVEGTWTETKFELCTGKDVAIVLKLKCLEVLMRTQIDNLDGENLLRVFAREGHSLSSLHVSIDSFRLSLKDWESLLRLLPNLKSLVLSVSKPCSLDALQMFTIIRTPSLQKCELEVSICQPFQDIQLLEMLSDTISEGQKHLPAKSGNSLNDYTNPFWAGTGKKSLPMLNCRNTKGDTPNSTLELSSIEFLVSIKHSEEGVTVQLASEIIKAAIANCKMDFTTLNLSNVDLLDDSAQLLGSYICRPECTLTSLNVSNASLGGIVLEEITLNENYFTSVGTIAISQAINACQTLRKFSFSKMELNVAFPTLTESICLKPGGMLSLDLTQAIAGVRTFEQAIDTMLQYSQEKGLKLQTVVFDGCQLSKDAYQKLGLLATVANMESMSLCRGANGYVMEEEGGARLFRELRRSRALKRINISGQRMGDQICNALHGLISSSSIEEVIMQSNRITDAGLKSLMSIYKKLPPFRRILVDIEDNYISSTGAKRARKYQQGRRMIIIDKQRPVDLE
ncbi:hypothetical protein HDU76_011447 [Blyttiomyces sp. JEL0837]|nr:hypothetical protein HDU76_011447 [Blyttiomyces sp. JEL0837]